MSPRLRRRALSRVRSKRTRSHPPRQPASHPRSRRPPRSRHDQGPRSRLRTRTPAFETASPGATARAIVASPWCAPRADAASSRSSRLTQVAPSRPMLWLLLSSFALACGGASASPATPESYTVQTPEFEATPEPRPCAWENDAAQCFASTRWEELALLSVRREINWPSCADPSPLFVARRSHTPGMLAPRALRAGRLDAGRRSVYFPSDTHRRR